MSNETNIARPSENRVAIVDQMKKFLGAREQMLAQYVTNGVRPEALIRFCLLDLSQNEKLQQCSPMSIYLSLVACAVTGLEPGALKGEAYIVPYGREATFVPGYKGLIKLARRSRDVLSMPANVVYANDHLELDLGTDGKVVHRPDLTGERGDIIGAYAAAKLSQGVEVEWMSVADLEKVKKASRGGPAWRDWEDQMFRKAPVKRLCKRLPLGSDYYIAAQMDDFVAGGDFAAYKSVIDVATDGEATRAEKAEQASAQAAEMVAKLNKGG